MQGLDTEVGVQDVLRWPDEPWECEVLTRFTDINTNIVHIRDSTEIQSM